MASSSSFSISSGSNRTTLVRELTPLGEGSSPELTGSLSGEGDPMEDTSTPALATRRPPPTSMAAPVAFVYPRNRRK